MVQNSKASVDSLLLKGILYVIVGSSSYGMLSTFVKLAYAKNYTTAEITIAQFVWGALALTILSLFINQSTKITKKEVTQLLLAGIPIGFTSILYYSAVRYIDASIVVVMLMQSVWIGAIIDSMITKERPTKEKLIAIFLVLLGTLLATNVFNQSNMQLDIRGVVLGFLSAISFSTTFFVTSKIAPHLHPIKRSQIMLYSGSVLVLIFAFLTQIAPYYLNLNLLGQDLIQGKSIDFTIFLNYGLIVAIFGTVIPPIMLNKGFPLVGVGLGSILASIELPFAMTIAFLFLGEIILFEQWIGVLLIIGAIVLLNYKLISSPEKRT